MKTKTKFIALAIIALYSCGCTAVKDYEKTVGARQVDLSGYAKGSGNYGAQARYRVEYR